MRISDWSSDVCSSDLPAGIGGEIALEAWRRRSAEGLATFFVIDDPRRLAALAGRLGLAVPIAEIAAPGAAREVIPEALPVRSEEHTSELQSLMRISYAVICLTKKSLKNKQHNN